VSSKARSALPYFAGTMPITPDHKLINCGIVDPTPLHVGACAVHLAA
jgi:hypothetical protein